MGFIWSQLFVTPTYPKTSFTGKTVIVTGSNVGLGLEAARHFARLDAKKVILAVRNLEAGERAKKDIEATTKRPGALEVWKLDLGSYDSVKSFAARCNTLDRLDVIVENAGIATGVYRLAEDNESTITVNVVSTILLALLLLPKMQETAEKFQTKPNLVMVSSEVHAWSKFPERDASDIFAALNDEKKFKAGADKDRYMVSKLLEVLTLRQIAPKLARGPNKDVTFNMLNPGLCHSSLAREGNVLLEIMKFLLARSTEVGSRTLVAGATVGPEAHGKYMHDGKVQEQEVAKWVRSPEGEKVGAQVWKELSAKLEAIQPGVTKNIE